MTDADATWLTEQEERRRERVWAKLEDASDRFQEVYTEVRSTYPEMTVMERLRAVEIILMDHRVTARDGKRSGA